MVAFDQDPSVNYGRDHYAIQIRNRSFRFRNEDGSCWRNICFDNTYGNKVYKLVEICEKSWFEVLIDRKWGDIWGHRPLGYWC